MRVFFILADNFVTKFEALIKLLDESKDFQSIIRNPTNKIQDQINRFIPPEHWIDLSKQS